MREPIQWPAEYRASKTFTRQIDPCIDCQDMMIYSMQMISMMGETK